MSDKNIERKQQAQLLYITQGKSHAEIADEVGVTERTVFNWVHQYAWDKLRLAAYQAPVSIANSLCSEIVEMQQAIALRETGQRFPTPQESMTMQRMVSCLEKMKKYPSLSQNMQILEGFKNYMKPINKEFSKDLGHYTDRYLSSAAHNGFAPYQLEYGVDAAPPLAPYYEEEETEPEFIPCPNMDTCLHPGNCGYPNCTKKPRPLFDNAASYSIPGIHYARPYLEPLMNICRKELAGPDENELIVNIIRSRYDAANTSPDPEISGNDPETTSIENAEKNRIEKAIGTPTYVTLHPEISGNKTEITTTENSTISPRLQDILSESSGLSAGASAKEESKTENSSNPHAPTRSGQPLNVEENGNDPEAKKLDQWRLYILSMTADQEDTDLSQAS
jgi:transposase-like protein